MRKLVKYLLLFNTILLFVMFIPQPNLFADPIWNSSNKDVLKVVLDDNYPPYSFRDEEGKLHGITIDQWRLWEKKTGTKVLISGMDWNACQALMQAGHFDVIDTIFYSPDRAKLYDFTKPYARLEVPIFFVKNLTGISDVKSIKGFTVGVKKGDNCIEILKQKDIRSIQEFDSYVAIIKAAQKNEIQVFVIDKPPAFYFMYKMGIRDQFNYSKPIYSGELHRAVKKGDQSTLNLVEKGFASITGKEYETIDRKWLGTPYLNPAFLRFTIGLIIGVILLILILILWNTMLQKKVMQKTSDLRKYFAALQISEEKYRELVSHLDVAIVVFTLDKEILIFNQAYQDLFNNRQDFEMKKHEPVPGWSVLDETGQVLPEDKHPSSIIIATGNPVTDYSVALLNPENKELTWLQVNGFPEKNAAGEIMHIVLTMVDITKIKKAEALLYEQSIHDRLTGLYNRAYFEDALSHINNESLSSLGLIICDLDGLKFINDTLGHSMGDEYLINSAKILRASFRTHDRIARIGGDEFAVIMPDSNEKEIEEYHLQLTHNIELHNEINGSIPLSISFGYSYKTGSKININEMFKEADNNMYRKKLHRRQSVKSDIVQAIKTLLKERELNTDDHADRMQDLASKLAINVGIRENELADIKLLAQFHDIGKVGIADRILLKRGRLNEKM